MIEIVFQKNNTININKIIDIYKSIYNKLKQEDNEYNFGYFIIHLYPFLKELNIEFMSFNQSGYPFVSIDINKFLYYIKICNEFIDINVIQNQALTCPSCLERKIVFLDNEYSCENCFLIYDSRMPGIKDIETTNKLKSFYSLKSNLIKAIERFEGKDVIILDQDLDSIKNTFEKRNIPFNLLQREHVYKILKELKLVKYYDCINIILNKLNNTPIRKISQHTSEILKYHNELENVYQFVNKNRINSLNIYFKLYKFCKLCKIEVDVEEFCCMLKTDQKFLEHELIWTEICKYTKWQ